MPQKIFLSIAFFLSAVCMACSIINKANVTDKVPLTIASVCMNALPDKQLNLKKIFSFMEEASSKGAQLIVFPEIALQQNPAWGFGHQPTERELDYLHRSAETIPGESTKSIVEKAKALSIYVILGMTEKSPNDEVLYNTCVILGPTGIVGNHHKRHVWNSKLSGNEDMYWTPSNTLGLVDSPLGKIGIMICGNMYYNFPESLSGEVTGPVLAEKGADFLVTITAWPGQFAYDDATLRNAEEANRWHIVSNQVGSVGYTTCYGYSRIIDPNGNIVKDTGASEGIIISETNLMIDKY